LLDRYWVADQYRGRQVQLALGAVDRSDVLRALDAVRQRETGLGDVEPRVGMGAIADDRHTEALESFERGVDVEDGLGTGADQDDGVLGEREQVGGLVEVLLSTVVHATQPTGGEHLDTRPVREKSGSCDGRTGVLVVDRADGQFAD